jgi:hypothetical protein
VRYEPDVPLTLSWCSPLGEEPRAALYFCRSHVVLSRDQAADLVMQLVRFLHNTGPKQPSVQFLEVEP